MSILDDLAASAPKVGGYPCATGEAINNHPDQADEIAAAVSSYDYTIRQIHEVLSAHGIYIKPKAISRHRRGDCQCQ